MNIVGKIRISYTEQISLTRARNLFVIIMIYYYGVIKGDYIVMYWSKHYITNLEIATSISDK